MHAKNTCRCEHYEYTVVKNTINQILGTNLGTNTNVRTSLRVSPLYIHRNEAQLTGIKTFKINSLIPEMKNRHKRKRINDKDPKLLYVTT